MCGVVFVLFSVTDDFCQIHLNSSFLHLRKKIWWGWMSFIPGDCQRSRRPWITYVGDFRSSRLHSFSGIHIQSTFWMIRLEYVVHENLNLLLIYKQGPVRGVSLSVHPGVNEQVVAQRCGTSPQNDVWWMVFEILLSCGVIENNITIVQKLLLVWKDIFLKGEYLQSLLPFVFCQAILPLVQLLNVKHCWKPGIWWFLTVLENFFSTVHGSPIVFYIGFCNSEVCGCTGHVEASSLMTLWPYTRPKILY